MDDKKSVSELLDDDKIREYFLSRDPNRTKPNPFLTVEAEEQYGGKASRLKIIGETTETEEKSYGISYSQHQKHVKDVAIKFLGLGISLGLLISIVLFLFV